MNLKDCKPSKLDKETQSLVNLIFDQDMFKGALKKYDIGKSEFKHIINIFN